MLDALEPRTLLSTTVNVTGNVADVQVYSNATLGWVGETAFRVGDNGTNVTEVAGVFPFQLPTLPVGAVITSVSANFTLASIGNAGSVVGSCDMYALGVRTAASVLTTDYFEGAYNTDATDATAIQQAFAINTTPAGALTTSSSASTNLKNYLISQYAAGGAGKYAFIRLNSSAPQATSRYWVFDTANHATAKPVLTITYDVTPAAPTGLVLTTTSSSTIDLRWTDNATNETNYIVERSTNGTDFTVAATLAADTATWQDTGRAADTKYYYRVHATNGSDSPNTPVQSDTTLPVFTHTIWVDKSYGGATKNGAFATPYTTIASAITASVVGDGIVVRNGTYNEKVTVKSGTTLMSMPNELATLSGFASITGWTLQSGSIYTTTVNFNPGDLFVDYQFQDMARSPNFGWWKAPTVTHPDSTTTVITDPTHLAGIPSLVGGFLQVHIGNGNSYDGAKITAHDTVAGTITVSGPNSADNIPAMANNDQYIVKNTAALLDRAGEWTVAPGGVAGTYVISYWPANVNDLNKTQARNQTGQQISVTNTSHEVVIRGLEITGNTGFGISIGGNSYNITVRDSIVHHNGGTGIQARYANTVSINNNLVLANSGTGVAVISTNGTNVSNNEIAYNVVDGLVIAGDISGKLPTDPNFVPTFNVTANNNYIHHHLGYSHSDGIQMYRTVSDVHVLNNVLTDNCQGIMTEEVDGAELGGNVIWNSAAYTVIFGHANSNNWNVHNNTIGGAGYGPYLYDGVGYTMTNNINVGKAGLSTTTYTGDYNFYNVYSGSIISAGGVSYSTVAAFYAATGDDQHSLQGDPLFINAPVVSTMCTGDITRNTTTTLYVNSVTGFAVGDHIQVDGDNVVRTITAVNTTSKTITFDVALASPPMTQYVTVNNWKTSTNYALDLRLQAGSPAATGSSTGGPMGSVLSVPAFVTGDFNGDGVRDVPTASAAIIAGLPNPISWAPPTYS